MNIRHRLTKDEWNMLDDLLGKHGFSGYYDLVETLKIVLERIENGMLKENWKETAKDLPTVVGLLLKVTERRG